MGLSICQACGTIVRGEQKRRCRSCRAVIAKNIPTPLAVFGIKESAPIGIVNYRTDHLLLERVLEVSQTDRLVWESPCKDGYCIHVEKEESESGKSNGDGASSTVEEKKAEKVPLAEREAEEPTASSPDQSEKAAKNEASLDKVVEIAKPEEPEPEESKPEELEVSSDSPSWVLATCGTSFDGISDSIQVALEDVGAEPLPDSQSFSATTLVFGSALDERVVTAEPQDLKEIYEKSIQSRDKAPVPVPELKKEPKEDKQPTPKELETKALFEKVEQTASAIFDQPDIGGSERDYSSEYKEATKAIDEKDEGTGLDSASGSDEWPEESYNRGMPKTSQDSRQTGDAESPYKSQFDLSQLKTPGDGNTGSDTSFNKGGMLKSKGAILGALVKFVIVTVVFISFGAVGLFFLGGNQSSVTTAGSMKTNEMGLPVLSGRWHIKMVVETENGEVGYGEIEADVVQTREEILGKGLDGNGNFVVSGNLGKAQEVMIAFSRHYDIDDGRQHPNPTRFKGVVSANPQESVIAQGSFANRLMQDLPALNKRQFEQIQGYWTLTIKQQSFLDKLKQMAGI